jgi:hypothetical protein
VLTVTWVPLIVSKVTVTTLLAVAETSRVSQMMASHLVTSQHLELLRVTLVPVLSALSASNHHLRPQHLP